jgi:hypothetical protein
VKQEDAGNGQGSSHISAFSSLNMDIIALVRYHCQPPGLKNFMNDLYS